MKPLTRLVMLFCLFVTSSIHAEANQLREQPKSCSDAFLNSHFNQVLPCYVIKPDNGYTWKITEEQTPHSDRSRQKSNVSVIKVDMTSLRWPTDLGAAVDHPIWSHRVAIYTPQKTHSDTALLHINGGIINSSNPDIKRANDDLEFARMAERTGSVVVDLKDIPNQFLTFGTLPPLKEDALVGYTWQKFLQDPERNREWPLQLPMIKSTVRAMDTAQSVLSDKGITINRFVLSGASKRGWTVWLTAAIDKRVSAIIPMVIDVLNMQTNIEHHKKVYGRLSPAVRDYEGLMPLLNSQPMNQLMEIVDPYSYRSLLAIPKFIISATGDEFFLPDASRFYFDDLIGPKWLSILPNQRHYITRQDAEKVNNTIESLYGSVVNNRVLPEVKTKYVDGRINISTSAKPDRVLLWSGQNKKARDFRAHFGTPPDVQFYSVPIPVDCNAHCTFSISVKSPRQGWNASFIELIYANPPYSDLSFTSRVYITPDVYPVFSE